MPEQRECPHCQKSAAEDAAFCSRCGSPLVNAAGLDVEEDQAAWRPTSIADRLAMTSREPDRTASLPLSQSERAAEHEVFGKIVVSLIAAAFLIWVIVKVGFYVNPTPGVSSSVTVPAVQPAPSVSPGQPTPADSVSPTLPIPIPEVDPSPRTHSANPIAGAWHEVRQFNGSSVKNTESFEITSFEWRIKWVTVPNEFGSGVFSITVHGSDGSYKALAANITGKSADSTIIRGSGRYYLAFAADEPYKVLVEEWR